MSIENNLKRIADSLEIIAGVADDKAVKSFAADVKMPDPVIVPQEECQDVPVAPVTVETARVTSPPVTPKPVTAVLEPAVPTPPTSPADRIAIAGDGIDLNTVNITIGNVEMTGAEFNAGTSNEDLNELIVAEYHRLGSQDGIIKVLKDNGCKDIAGLDKSKYYYVLTAIRGLS